MVPGFLTQLQWREPLAFLLALQPALILWVRSIGQHRALLKVADPGLQPWVIQPVYRSIRERILSRDTLYIFAWILFALAAAGPRVPESIPGKPVVAPQDVMIVVDVSRSMQAADIRPNRIKRARIELQEMLKRPHHGRMGIILYAGSAHLYVPLTWDDEALAYYIDQLDRIRLPVRGSNLASALDLANKQFAADARGKAILLLTDGDMSAYTSAQQAQLQDSLKRLESGNIPLFILGLGTVEGDSIPDTQGQWVTEHGQVQVSRLDENTLANLARNSGGEYSAVRDDDSDWVRLYDRGIARLDTRAGTRLPEQVTWREYYAYPLLLGMLLWFTARIPYQLGKIGTLAFAPLLLIFLSATQDSHAMEIGAMKSGAMAKGQEARILHQAYQHYRAGEYKKAAGLYELLPGYDGYYGVGVSAYQRSEFDPAIRAFTQAVLESDTDAQRGSALYNLGNSYFRTGNYMAAIQVYEDALLYRPGHAATMHNLAFSRTLQQAVEKREALVNGTRRGGKGPRTARLQGENTQDNNSAVSLGGDETSKPQSPTPLPDIPTNHPMFEQLVDKGVEYIRLSSRQTDAKFAGHGESKPDLEIARLRMQGLAQGGPDIWQRIFEVEDGFPAPLEQPRVLPGVAPW